MKNKETREIILKRGSKPYIRWWWFANSIKKEDISYQIEWIATNGFGGVEIAWIYPSKKNKLPEPFLSDGWADLVNFAFQECEKNKLVCDLSFGTLWPFGGSFVIPEFASRTWERLSTQQLKNSWESAYSNDPRPVIDHLNHSAFEFYAEHMLTGFKNILSSQSNRETHKPSSFFCDSLEVETEGLWTDHFEEQFRKHYNYSISPYMKKLDKNPHRRFEYRRVVSDLFLEEFFIPYNKMCSDNNMLSRVQAHGALTDILKAFSLCDIPESEALLFDPEFSFIPASASVLADRPVTSCEAFTCLYGWVKSPEKAPYIKEEKIEDLKLLADALFACGVNHIVWHGMPFNGKGESQQFYATVHVGREGSLSPHLKTFNNYMSFISNSMQEGRPLTSIAVYLPIEDMQIKDRVPKEKQKPSSLYHWEMHDIRWPEHINGYHPTWVSTPFLKEAYVNRKTGNIHIDKAIFTALYINAKWLTLEGLEALVSIAADGGRIIVKSLPAEPGTVKHNTYSNLLEKLTKYKKTLKECPNNTVYPFLTDLDNKKLPLYRTRITGSTITCFIAHPEANGITYPMEYGHGLNLKEHTRNFRFQFLAADSKKISIIDYTANFKPGESKLISIDFLKDGSIKEIHLPDVE